MKNKLLLFISVSMLVFSSCNKEFLVATPQDQLTNETFWNTEDDALGALRNCYMGGFYANQPYRECRSDNSLDVYNWMDEGSRDATDGSINPSGGLPSATWSMYYTAVRQCNFFLENISKVNFRTTGLKERMQAEVRFIRAWNYVYLAADFGNVPIVTKTLSVQESKEVKQSTQADVYKFAISEADTCSKILLADYPSSEMGRINKGCCIALKARAHLFQNDYTNVLKAVADLEALNKYSLYTGGTDPYSDLFSGSNQRNAELSEAILTVLFAPITGKLTAGVGNNNNAQFIVSGYAPDAYGTTFATGGLSDAYPMADGRLIHETGSTYDPSKPNLNRDPRKEKTLVCPGENYFSFDGINSAWDVPFEPENPNSPLILRYDFKYAPPTGIFWKKGLDVTAWGLNNVWNCLNDLILIRWADVLLMKAEALAEINGSANEVCNIIDQLRDRTGGGRVHRENYTTKDNLINLVRNERRIELANEGLRYYDLIRWKIAEQDPITTGAGLNGELHGAFMRLDGIGATDRVIIMDGVARRFVETRIFDKSKQYLFPIPQGEIDLNPNLKQNPGW